MGAYYSRGIEDVLDVDVGEGLTEWADDNLNFGGTKMNRLERSVRARLRVNHKILKTIANNYSEIPCFFSVGIVFSGDCRTGVVIVAALETTGSAVHDGVEVGDVLVYIDMFDIQEVSAYYTYLDDLKLRSDEAPPDFNKHRESSSLGWRSQLFDDSFEALLSHLVAGPKGSVVRLGFKRGENVIIMYKALPRSSPQKLVPYQMNTLKMEKEQETHSKTKKL